MKPRFIQIQVVAILSAVAVASAEEVIDFARYQVILDRKPFGELKPPAPPAAPAGPDKAAEFFNHFRVSGLVVQEGRPDRVGLVDKRGNKSYLLAVGDSEDGIEVISADFAGEEASIRYSGQDLTIKLAAGDAQPAKPGEGQPAAAPAAPGAPPAPTLSYADRRRSRTPQPPPEPVVPKLTGEALQKHLQEYQMEVIRKGLPPLPIPLNKDQDDQLVREGILPAQ